MQRHVNQATTSLPTWLRETGHNVTTNLQMTINDGLSGVKACHEEHTSMVLHELSRVQDEQRKLSLHLASFIDGQLRHPSADMVPVAINDISNVNCEETIVAPPNMAAFTQRFCTCFASVPLGFRRNLVQARGNHHEGCIYAYQNRKKHRFSMEGRILNRIVCLTVDFEYSLMA